MRIDSPFWSRYIRLVKNTVIPYQYEAIHDRIPEAEKSFAIQNFRIAAGHESGEFQGMVFQDSDVAKWLEAVGYSLQVMPDPDLERLADEVIDLVAAAQQPDGYLNTYFTIKEPDKRWTNLAECHELYCAGHMMEAAVAYFDATGKRRLLDVMCKFADYIDSVFGKGEGQLQGYDGHQEIELALIKLYRTTVNDRYLKLSKYFIDVRGQSPNYLTEEWERRGRKTFFPEMKDFGGDYAQAHEPVRQQQQATGHAVRAVYMYTAMADIAAETGDVSLYEACKRLWDNLTGKRMYITGAIGSQAFGERFSYDYDLPNDLAYAETCASIGLIFFAERMLRLEPNSQYADVLERALYNTVLAGMSLDGKKFFYVNPLEVVPEACHHHNKQHVKAERQGWFGCACCPPNVARLLSSLGNYVYSTSEKTAFVHLYVGGEAKLKLGTYNVRLVQETDFPNDNKVAVKVFPGGEAVFSLAFRQPNWCPTMRISVNGEPLLTDGRLMNGYIMVDRLWKDGDVVELELEMPIIRMNANPLVRETIGKVALQRGPFVYCLEEADNGNLLHELLLPKEAELQAIYQSDLLGGVTIIRGLAERTSASEWNGELYKPASSETSVEAALTFIPYYAWANRACGEMTVWMREE
ncbi:beta-L-arabinofuranosidase domain-containing protein [Paenibacillus sp. LHD-38]|uniref:glycoside hydrolase family 127 protein n=1 Tax=Paenibacillus sp. LHD-38 TaxID=3072143 RepID=UPI00280E7584|nr:beta-L-arabinofuranosidase domain-containing protein [Paenibacillus sp. LHD-38]MDQ8737716.1 glycoside hydrolase family 127 protein [Paenibacillus sp. LHD-38]